EPDLGVADRGDLTAEALTGLQSVAADLADEPLLGATARLDQGQPDVEVEVAPLDPASERDEPRCRVDAVAGLSAWAVPGHEDPPPVPGLTATAVEAVTRGDDPVLALGVDRCARAHHVNASGRAEEDLADRLGLAELPACGAVLSARGGRLGERRRLHRLGTRPQIGRASCRESVAEAAGRGGR